MNYIKNVEVLGLFGKFNLNIDLQPGINVLYGKNGSGKTTFLHILANILNGDFRRFAFIEFKLIKITLDNNSEILLKAEKTSANNQYIIVITMDDKLIDKLLFHKTNKNYPMEFNQDIDKEQKSNSIISTAYFPAFRTMIEAWKSVKKESILQARGIGTGLDAFNPFSFGDKDKKEQQKTIEFARKLFGGFVPNINYPSPQDIEERLEQAIQQALGSIMAVDQKLIVETLENIFKTMSQKESTPNIHNDEKIKKITSLNDDIEKFLLQTEAIDSTNIYSLLSKQIQSLTAPYNDIAYSILNVFQETLENKLKVIKDAFEPIDRYLHAVNEFLEDKQLARTIKDSGVFFSQSTYSVAVLHKDETTTDLQSLSSGERQILTLIYAATYMSEEQVILIDEPELSLHVDWQERLLRKMSEHLKGKQIIACTHSPSIASDYIDRLKELKFVSSINSQSQHGDTEDEELL